MIENEKNRKKASILNRFFVAFCCFFTALSISSELLISKGLLYENSMHNFCYAMAITFVLSIIWNILVKKV